MDSESRALPLIKPGPGTAAPVFERIGIVGLGLIGGSIALAARRAWPSSLVIGVDNHEVLERAVALHAIDVGAPDLTILGDADVVILAAPVLENISLLARLPGYLEQPVVLSDVGSTKRAIVEASRALPPHIRFVGGHPLAGAARGGIDAARPDLFERRPWLFTTSLLPEASPADAGDQRAADAEIQTAAVGRLTRFVEGLGAIAHTIDAESHDRLVAFISHLPQLVASTLMAVVGEGAGEQDLALAGAGLADTTRLAASPADIWTDICASNHEEIGRAMDLLIDRLSEVRRGLASREAVGRLFEAANRWRAVLGDRRR